MSEKFEIEFEADAVLTPSGEPYMAGFKDGPVTLSGYWLPTSESDAVQPPLPVLTFQKASTPMPRKRKKTLDKVLHGRRLGRHERRRFWVDLKSGIRMRLERETR